MRKLIIVNPRTFLICIARSASSGSRVTFKLAVKRMNYEAYL